MTDTQSIRIIDVNLNRSGEGLRVLEEIARFVINDAKLALRFKELRHKVSMRVLSTKLICLSARQADKDVGEKNRSSFQYSTKSLAECCVANFRRAQESLRVLEELAPTLGLEPQLYADSRFELYTLEKELIGDITRRETAKKIRHFYAVIDSNYSNTDNNETRLKELLNRVSIIQLNNASDHKSGYLSVAKQLRLLCHDRGALLIIPNHFDVMLAVGADGIILSRDGMPTVEMRCLLPIDKLLGRVVTSAEEASQASAEGADFLLFNGLESLENEKWLTLGAIKKAVDLPLVATGLQTELDINEAFAGGADAIDLMEAA
ncbi:MAG: thiamine phosphate synthase [Dehalococcoidia bacterium]|nr:thiamine phosphate synthase [Dehalococcoidia bacterium]